MGYYFVSTGRSCATCKYWQGDRELRSKATQVYVGSTSDLGRCSKRDCPRFNEMRKAHEQCPKWEKL